MVSGSPLSGPSEDVCRPVFGFLPAANLPASAPLTHTPEHTRLHQPAQHGHEVHALRPEVIHTNARARKRARTHANTSELLE